MRSWMVTLAGLPWLNANRKLHHQRHAECAREIRKAARDAAFEAGVPGFPAVFVLGYVHPGSLRRYDPANWYPSFKPAVDGLVDAGVVTDDDHTRVSGPHMLPAHRVTGGQLTLVIAEARRCRCGHDGMEHIGGGRCVRPGCGCLVLRQPVRVPAGGAGGTG